MELPIIILAALTLIGVIVLIALYILKEKRKADERAAEIAGLKDQLEKTQRDLKTNTQDASNQLAEKFHSLANDIRLAQNEANQQVKAGFVQMQSESSSIRKDVDEKIDDIRSAFKEYSENVNRTLSEYSASNAEFRNRTQEVKNEIKAELTNILLEIKSPLDLD